MANTELIAGAGFLEKRFTQGGTTESPKIYKFEPPEGMGPVAWMDFTPRGQLVAHGVPRDHVDRRIKEYILVCRPNNYTDGNIIWFPTEYCYPSFFNPRASMVAINTGHSAAFLSVARGDWDFVSTFQFDIDGTVENMDFYGGTSSLAVSDNGELGVVGFQGRFQVYDLTRPEARQLEEVEFKPIYDFPYRLDGIHGINFLPNSANFVFSKYPKTFLYRPGFGEGGTLQTTRKKDGTYGQNIWLLPPSDRALVNNGSLKVVALDSSDNHGCLKTIMEFPNDWVHGGTNKRWSGQWSFDDYLRNKGYDGFLVDPFDFSKSGYYVNDLAVYPDGKTVILAGEQSFRFFSVDGLDLGIKPKEIGRLHFDHPIDKVAVNPVNGDVVYTEL